MNRLVANQKERRSKLEEQLKEDPSVNIQDDRTYYNPRFFLKEVIQNPGQPDSYKYTPIAGKYWSDRENGNWQNSPKIFHDDCKEFY